MEIKEKREKKKKKIVGVKPKIYRTYYHPRMVGPTRRS
jgi:hypothetical protein